MATLPTLPTLPSLSTTSRTLSPDLLSAGGAGGAGGGLSTGGDIPPIGGGGSGIPGVISGAASGRFGTTPTASASQTSNASLLSSVLPSIPWGRIAAFLLGLILIAAGLYLIKQIQQVVNTSVKTVGKAAAHAAAAGDE